MLKKLSLAALIAMGSMSVAGATPLTQAIKGVDLSGMLRIRYYHEMPKNANSYNRWRTNAILVFSVPVGENLKMVMRNSVESNVYSDDDTADLNKSSVDTNIANNLLFMKYSNGPVNAILGKIPVATPVTSTDPVTPAHGAGAIATYTLNKNLTVAAAYIDALKQGGSETDVLPSRVAPNGIIPNDIYAAAVIFNNDLFSGNAWYFQSTNLMKYITTLSLDISPVNNVDLHVDYARGKLNADPAATLGVSGDAKNYYNVYGKYSQKEFCVKVGYAYTDKHASPVVLAADAPIGNVIPTANNSNIANEIQMSSLYAKVGYNVNSQTNVYIAYQTQKDHVTKNNFLKEYTLGGSYAYNKKLGFSAYYDYTNYRTVADGNDQAEFRFETKYSF